MILVEQDLPVQAQAPENPRIELCLQQRINGSHEISAVAGAIVSMFRDMNMRLAPIIGLKGVAALYRRSLLLAMGNNADLAAPYSTLVVAMDFPHFQSLMLNQDPIEAAQFGALLLQTTYELLVTLIGSALCERLLYTVWENPLNAPPAQEAHL